MKFTATGDSRSSNFAPARAARGGAIPPRGFKRKRVRVRENQKKWQNEMKKKEARRLEEARALARKYNYPIEDIECRNKEAMRWAMKSFMVDQYNCKDKRCLCRSCKQVVLSYWGNFVLKDINPCACKRTAQKTQLNQPYTAKWCSGQLESVLKDKPTTDVRACLTVIRDKIKNDPTHKGKVHLLTQEVVRRGKDLLLAKIMGPSSNEYFGDLEFIRSLVQQADPENEFHWETEMVKGKAYYSRMVLIPGCLKRILPFLKIVKACDAAHMYGIGSRMPLGKLYNFTAKDGNNHLHFAIGHGGNESTPEWFWFLNHFLRDLCNKDSHLITDQMGGLKRALVDIQKDYNQRSKDAKPAPARAASGGAIPPRGFKKDEEQWWFGLKDHFYDPPSNNLKNWSVCAYHKYQNIRDTYGVKIAKLYINSCNVLTLQQFNDAVDRMEAFMANEGWSRKKKDDFYL